MDKKAKICMEYLGKALFYTRENIESVIPYWNRRKDIDGEEYDRAVVEIKYKSGKTIYVNVEADSNFAAIYDVMSVLSGHKNPIDPILIEKLIPIKD